MPDRCSGRIGRCRCSGLVRLGRRVPAATVAVVNNGTPGDAHSRLITSRAGRWVVALVLVVGGVWIVGPNMPAGPFRDQVDALWRPATEAGLVQDWGVFSPNPRDQSLDVRARVEFDDDTSTFWDVPELDPIVGAYRQYRWQKWQERVRLDDNRWMWDTTAAWIAGQVDTGDRTVVRVTLIRRWIDHEPLGTPEPIDSDWNEFEYHVWEPAP